MSEQTGSRDGQGAGDHDDPYHFGNPRGFLSERALGYLLILRGRIQDARHGLDDVAAEDLEPSLWPSTLLS